MVGAIIGDIIGSRFEFNNIKTKEFKLFTSDCHITDDSVCTIAIADCILNSGDPVEYLQKYCRKYENWDLSLGGMFKEWIYSKSPQPYYSWGNGAAMRISPVGFTKNHWETKQRSSAYYTGISHNHPLAFKGAEAVCRAIHYGNLGANKNILFELIHTYYPTYDLSLSLEEISKTYRFDESCEGTVPYALHCVISSVSFEDAIRNAISLGGDSDTLACIAGGIAQAFYKFIPQDIIYDAMAFLPQEFIQIIGDFNLKNKIEYNVN